MVKQMLEDKDDINSSKELVEEEKRHAEEKQTDNKDSLGVFHEDSKLYTEKDCTGKCPDPGVTNGIPWRHSFCNVSRLSPLIRTTLVDSNL